MIQPELQPIAGRFDGKVLFATGAASGLGEATARRFAAEGARVVVADIDTAVAERVANGLPDAHVVTVDVSDAVSVQRGVADAEAHYGGIDVVFNNAGIVGDQAVAHEMPVSNWDKVTSVNSDGVFYTLKYALAALMRRGGGSVVNTASAAGMAARSGISPYSFAKAGVIGLTRAAALEYGPHGIRVNAVAPTTILTPLVEYFIATSPDPAERRARMDSGNFIPGSPVPADVAAAVAFLASEDARWITGHTLPVDGGAINR